MKRKIEILRPPYAGYCFGVKRAMRIVEEGLEKFGQPLYTLGDIIHNPPEVERLKRLGVKSVNSLYEVPNGATLVLRAHGVLPSFRVEAESRGIRVLDATCPFVQRSQLFARKTAEEGRRVIVIGDAEHPEVISVAAHSGGKALVVRNSKQAEDLVEIERAGVVIQTTFSRDEADAIIDILRKRVSDLKVHDTICEATEARRKASLEIARKVDLMIVLGGHNSSNTKRLYEACRNAGVKSNLVESPDEILPEWFDGIKRIGLTTGTSTPDWIIEAALERIHSICKEDR